MSSDPDRLPAGPLAALAALIEAHAGLRFSEARWSELADKARGAFATSGCASWEAYAAHLLSLSGEAARQRLVEALTVGETCFFRHRPYFDVLGQQVLPELIARRETARQLRLWSAGCASGEETYSLAILLRGLLPDLDRWRATILGTDLNRVYLMRAEAGLYTDWSFRETDEIFKAAYFVPEGKCYRIRSDLRRMVRFAQLNLAKDSYPSVGSGLTDVDLILCRNVLMYMAPDVTRNILARLREALRPGGWLVIGPSDPQPEPQDGFEPHITGEVVLFRRPEHRRTALLAPPAGDQPPAPAFREHRAALAARTLFQAPAPPAVPVSEGSSGPSGLGIPGTASVMADHRPGSHSRTRTFRTVPSRPRSTGAAQQPATAQHADPGGMAWREAWQAARLSADDGSLAEAEAHCQRALAAAPFRPEPHYLLGTLRVASGHDEDALASFRRALYLDRSFVPALIALAALHQRTGRRDKARQALERAHGLLADRGDEELVLAEEGLTVGRLRGALIQMLDPNR